MEFYLKFVIFSILKWNFQDINAVITVPYVFMGSLILTCLAVGDFFFFYNKDPEDFFYYSIVWGTVYSRV